MSGFFGQLLVNESHRLIVTVVLNRFGDLARHRGQTDKVLQPHLGRFRRWGLCPKKNGSPKQDQHAE